MVHLDRHKIKWSDLEREETQVIGVGTRSISLPVYSLSPQCATTHRGAFVFVCGGGGGRGTVCVPCTGGFASVYKGKYLGEPVAIKELRSAELDPAFSEQGSVNRDDESRRLTYEEFRHEVWIMRYY
jgi:hypothetical protein